MQINPRVLGFIIIGLPIVLFLERVRYFNCICSYFTVLNSAILGQYITSIFRTSRDINTPNNFTVMKQNVVLPIASELMAEGSLYSRLITLGSLTNRLYSAR